MNLDERLREALHSSPFQGEGAIGMNPRTANEMSDSHRIAQIKEAFKAEGWTEPLPLTATEVYIKEMAKLRSQFMTGPEWLARFEKEVEALRDAPGSELAKEYFAVGLEKQAKEILVIHMADQIMTAARRAAGLEAGDGKD